MCTCDLLLGSLAGGAVGAAFALLLPGIYSGVAVRRLEDGALSYAAAAFAQRLMVGCMGGFILYLAVSWRECRLSRQSGTVQA